MGSVKPFFKWAGGKVKLIPQLLPLLPKDVRARRYVEPFLGSGALFFASEPKKALLSDCNVALMSTYVAIRADPLKVIRKVEGLLRTHTSEKYYARRDSFNALCVRANAKALLGRQEVDAELAPLFLYLNRTCYNGLYRVNASGSFNTPCGRYEKPHIDEQVVKEAARCLQPPSVQLQCKGFNRIEIRSKDFVYIDPPYHGGFTAYSQQGFSEESQKELAWVVKQASETGAKIMLSNSNTALIRRLYKGFVVTKISAPRAINSNGSGRGKVMELMIRNYET